MMKKLFMAVTAVVLTASCGGGGASDGGASGEGKTTLTYALWDDVQQGAYQQCADAFQKANPDITIKITQNAWDQYWQSLTTQMVSGDAPDVITMQASFYPQFVKNGQLLDIQPMVTADKVDLTQYWPGLAESWVKDGKRYGLPKDWDTMAIIYNVKQAKEAGVDLTDLTWNPKDGGTFEDALAKLTVDTAGKRGDEPGFDKTKIAVYGYAPELNDGSLGQNSWGNLAVSNGFSYIDKNPFGTKYFYDDPKLVETAAWFKTIADKGYTPSYDKTSSLGTDAVLTSGKAALGVTGSWMIKTYLEATEQEFAFAPLPAGPLGRKSSFNGLADVIYAGTEHKDAAWKWVKFLGSTDCQNIVADNAVVFPAITSATERVLAAHEKAGREVQLFVDQAKAENGTFLLPVSDHADEINQIMGTAFDEIWLGQKDAKTSLTAANQQVNSLLAGG
ncbi:sugar ABC transporter substrate-binding protein [Nonomuraea glycinis]|uniref:Sugar ABC transporter substrate-binding protein n=1 Tax=Nonomuraea glycinis TaxID=2047744 RepID=A0A918E3I9_9ACTN|nr:sugar ABC transporter substrate-binding protein [Nonomuraea glycinis]MCA2174825.1 sugar ABC transporter substrate-binding protein [Nonomuraea glycinis]GGP01585.1 sugar ABC transporter substrate-binding protein [Nonomuraea glycinis]